MLTNSEEHPKPAPLKAGVADANREKYVDLKRELLEVQALLRAVVDVLPALRDVVDLKSRLLGDRETVAKVDEMAELLGKIHTETKLSTNRVFEHIKDSQRETQGLVAFYTNQVEKEIALIANIREQMQVNDEQILRTIIALGAETGLSRSRGWVDAAKQYAAQVIITVGLLALLVGAYHLVAAALRLIGR